VSDHGGPTTFSDDLDLETLGSQQAGDGLRAGFHVCLVEGRKRHAGYPGERFEVLAQCRYEFCDPSLQSAQSGWVKVWGENVIGHESEPTHPCARGTQGAGDTRDARHTTYSDPCVWTQEDP